MKKHILQLYWAITRAYLRLRGAEVGKNVRCNGFPHIKVRQGGRLVIGDDVQINAARWSNAHVVAGSTNLFVAAGAELILGKGVGLSGARIVAMQRIVLEEGAMIGAGCLICDSDMHEIPLGATSEISVKPINIGRKVFVGAQSIILKGVTIGTGSVIAAGSVVTKSVSINSLVGGNPSRVIKTFDMPSQPNN